MKNNSINLTVQYDLCCGCGICKSICPVKCISWEKMHGLYHPNVQNTQCIHCGRCISVCPGLGHPFATRSSSVDTVTGNVRECYNAWAKNAQFRHNGASGGVVSTLVQSLVVSGEYDGAFCVDSYDYREQLNTRLYKVEDVVNKQFYTRTPKSRYLPVSHENTVSYLMEHREERLILIGSSCAIRGLNAAIKKLGLNRDMYLFIGLFCDRVFNYNVLPYFEDTYAEGNELRAVHFKNKESGGWPGDMKFFPENGAPIYVSSSERVKAKDYFMLERCLYCVDKLNVSADISLGDNYTEQDNSKLGSNSAIIRTEKGRDAWQMVCDNLEIRSVSIASIQKAQALDWRMNNLYFGDLKTLENNIDLNAGVPRENDSALYKRAWRASIKKLETGANYDIAPKAVKKEIRRGERPNPFGKLFKSVAHRIKRIVR